MTETRITSKSNEHIQQLRKLIADRDYRYASGRYVLEGFRSLDGARGAVELFVREDREPVEVPGARVYRVEQKIFDGVAATENSQGVIAVMPLVLGDASRLDRHGRYVLLDRLQDPGNMGSVLRTACAFGFEGVLVMPGCVDPFSPKAVRSSAGAAGKMPVFPVQDMGALEEFTVIGADMQGTPLPDFAWPDGFILAIGNEARGLSDEVRAVLKDRVAIPIGTGMESLNAGVAAGILLYAASRGARRGA